MKKSLKMGTLYLTLSSFIFLASGYIINIWLGRFLGPASYGIYGVIISLISIINIIQTSGLPQAVSKYISEDERKSQNIMKNAFILQTISTLIMTVLLFMLAGPISLLLKDYSLKMYIQISSLILPLYGIFALYLGYYNGLHNFGRQSIMNTAYYISKTIFIFVLGYLFHLKGVLFGFIIAPFFALLFGFHFPNNSKVNFPYKGLILFSLPLIGFVIFSNLIASIDLFFVKALLKSNENTGYFTASQNISRIPFFGLSAFSLVIFPSISRSVSKNLEEKSKLMIRESLRFILLLLVPSTIIISSSSHKLIQFLYSNTYIQATNSLSILIFGYAFLTIFTILANILNGAGNPRLSMIISGFCAGINAILCLLFIPKIGLTGAAIATTISSFIAMSFASYFVYKQFKVLVPLMSIIRILTASLIVYTLARSIQLPPLFLPFTYILLFGIYFFILILFREVTKDDWKRVQEVVPSWVPLIGKQ